jgi:hypothetical protein
MRQITNQLHPFECNSDGTLNHILVVTNYSRPAADQDEPLSHELRSPAALKKTMDYLILMVCYILWNFYPLFSATSLCQNRILFFGTIFCGQERERFEKN